MTEQNTSNPGFGATLWIPLTEKQFACLGKIAATLGQLETLVDKLLVHLTGVRSEADLELLLAGRQFGSKVSLMRSFADRMPEPQCIAIRAACTALAAVAVDRNHAIHGQWGRIQQPGGSQDGKVIAASNRNPDKQLEVAPENRTGG